jgi:hypothetical protein
LTAVKVQSFAVISSNHTEADVSILRRARQGGYRMRTILPRIGIVRVNFSVSTEVDMKTRPKTTCKDFFALSAKRQQISQRA